ncbi:ComEC/Rec2 family competence protein [Kordiimonas sp. SCSIO 12610]|uniref:ComEC/Rec2 family competence protein n=1 Tax=Kordiimonas sp. SCSIO 12610 TaxID=2829597 RepID=UPI002109841F|nr:ComEC/Rec2 family competence protein [Kordiimonas sp. SCSIO 12610]UTW54044.1 ComEC/Rec2 family competence protein [Kordiimonas sp. SCSIO 12610]
MKLSLHSEWRIFYGAICFALGLALYYTLPFDLPVSIPAMVFVTMLAFQRPRYRKANPAYISVILFAAGILYACLRIEYADHHFIEETVYFSGEAIIEDIQERENAPVRLTLENLQSLSDETMKFNKVRLFVRTKIPEYLLAGDKIRFSAVLERPQGKLSPTGYDFARAAYFDGVQASGYVTTDIERAQFDNHNGASIGRVRQEIAEKLVRLIPGEAGGLAAALIVGRRSYLSDDAIDNLRASGLAHMLAISGLHMGLFVGAAFFMFEFVFLFVPIASPNINGRKLAAIFAWIAATGYLLLSGMSVATIRAFVIATIAIVAILLDRRVVSLRSIAIAAWAILIISPHAVMSAGFQMSFAATIALVCVYEIINERRRIKYEQDQPVFRTDQSFITRFGQNIGRFIGYTSLTTVIAQIAILPIALFHFQSVAVLGLFSNLVAVPVLLFIVVPFGFLSAVLGILGLEALSLPFFVWGLEQILDIAAFVADVEWSRVFMHPIHDYIFIMSLLVGCGLILIRHNRYVSSILFAMYLMMPLTFYIEPPSLIITQSGHGFVFQSKNGQFTYYNLRLNSFAADNYKKQWGLGPHVDTKRGQRSCDDYACSYDILGDRTAINVKHFAALYEACVAGDIVIILRKWVNYCRSNNLVIIKEQLATEGPLFIYENDNQNNLIWVNDKKNRRPWSGAE